MTLLPREHDFQMKDMESMRAAKEGGGSRKGAEEEEVKVARTYTLKCFKCFGSHAARECEMRVMCRSCKPEETKKNSHCTKAHSTWTEWKNKMKARGEEKGGAGGGIKRTGEEIPAAKTKKQKISDNFFKQNKMSKEEKNKFLNTMVKYIDWEDQQEQE